MGWPDPKFRTKICEILIPGIFCEKPDKRCRWNIEKSDLWFMVWVRFSYCLEQVTTSLCGLRFKEIDFEIFGDPIFNSWLSIFALDLNIVPYIYKSWPYLGTCFILLEFILSSSWEVDRTPPSFQISELISSSSIRPSGSLGIRNRYHTINLSFRTC